MPACLAAATACGAAPPVVAAAGPVCMTPELLCVPCETGNCNIMLSQQMWWGQQRGQQSTVQVLQQLPRPLLPSVLLPLLSAAPALLQS